MGAYLDRLNREYDELTAGIDTVIDRAADEDRDVTDAEAESVNRDRERMTTLKAEIERYTAVETEQAAVQKLRSSVPAPQRTAVTVTEPEYDIAREFPTVGDWAITVHRAMVKRDPEAIAKLDRATAHQTTADNPGIIPRPVLGPVLNFLNTARPFINSITRRPLPAGAFDRPRVTQHVAVAKQAAEKDLTASQKLLIDKIGVTAATYAGHLNISRQDVKWTSPNIMQIVFDDFAGIYAQVTDNDAADQFVTGIGAPVGLPAFTAADINTAVYAAAVRSLQNANAYPDTMWVSPDVWGQMGGLVTNQDAPVFPSLSVTSQSGNPLGLKLVVDPNFVDGTMVIGPSRYAEWYEDVDGLMQVGEPDVLGQLVGYAGYGAFVNVMPTAFTSLTPPAVAPGDGGGTQSTRSTSKS